MSTDFTDRADLTDWADWADWTEPMPFRLSSRQPVSLAEVLVEAPQLTRVDRKYLVDVATAQALIDGLSPDFRVLSIRERRSTSYLSTYFDTADLASVRAHVQRRRLRWKARSRLYVEDKLCRVEVKTSDGRGVTAKTVADADLDSYGRLDEASAAFVAATLAENQTPVDVRELRPTMEIAYRRTTLADTVNEMARITLDWQVHCTLDGQRVWLDDDYVLVETKGGLRPGQADRLLAALGHHPRSFSKYAAAASLIRDDLHDNDVRRLHGRQLHTVPAQPVLERATA
jgi:VTC domain-containing protein